jgi:hypothetical protein
VTCIVGIEHADGVTIGADSASSNGWIRTSHEPTRRSSGSVTYLIGFTSSWRMGQLLRYQLDVAAAGHLGPGPLDGDAVHRRRAGDVEGRRVRHCTTTAPSMAARSSSACCGRLYSVFDDYQVGHAAEGHDAVGSGGALALGSLHTTRSGLIRSRARAALEAAATTRRRAPPFTIETD